MRQLGNSAFINSLNALVGRSSLPVYELDKTKVQTRSTHIHPFPPLSQNLSFSAWRLAHAVKKADCLRWPLAWPQWWLSSTGFLLENGYLFDWNENELRLKQGMSNFYADFTNTGLAGRIAQGMALLLLEDKGYSYVGRFETVWKQHTAKWPANKKKAPDFIVENAQQEWVLAESKGGFSRPGRKPPIKKALKKGLEQLDGWDKFFTPQPTKSFVVGTFLRETGDTSDEGSLIAFVDPGPDTPENPVEFPPDTIRRANYASWLSFMGFENAASRIRTDIGEPQSHELPIISLGQDKFAISIASISPRLPDLSSREFWKHFDKWLFHPFWKFREGIRIDIAGLDLEVLKVLGKTSDYLTDALMELSPQEKLEGSFELKQGTFHGSIFSDGSLLGEIELERPRLPMSDFEWEEIIL